MRVSSRCWCVVLVATGCAGPEDDLTRSNEAPRAALRAPVIAPLGVPVAFDASASLDPDGDPLTYVFHFNDGSEAAHTGEPLAFHTFNREALVTVVVRVVDLRGIEAMACQDVSIRGEYPSPPDFCDVLRPCVVGDECDDGVCFANGGAID